MIIKSRETSLLIRGIFHRSINSIGNEANTVQDKQINLLTKYYCFDIAEYLKKPYACRTFDDITFLRAQLGPRPALTA